MHRIEYDDFSVGFFQDRDEKTFGESIRYSLLPVTTTLVLDYHFQNIDYDTFPLDSNNHIVLIGIEEGLTPQLKVSVRGGYTFRSYVNDGDSMDPNIKSTLTYTGAHNSTVSWITSYSMEEPNTIVAQSRNTIRTGLNASYDVLDRITATAAVYYHHDENQGFPGLGRNISTFQSDAFDISLGIRYRILDALSIDLDFHYTEVNSDVAIQSYSRSRISAGLSYKY
jgi:long-subunit fatty acid transport protein